MAKFRVVIPARYASSRFPGKPLADIGGKPMIERVYERARASHADSVVIATDDERIAAVARSFGASVVMTAVSHVSGTDRIAEVARILSYEPSDIVVNVQGDEPRIPPAIIDQVADILRKHAAADIATAATPIGSLEEFLDPNVVKVVTDAAGRAMYFSRAPIPWTRDGASGGLSTQRLHDGARRHVGIYAYRVRALLALAKLPASPLETSEKLEQLRALTSGMQIFVENAAQPPGPDVNTPEDLARLSAGQDPSAFTRSR